LTPKSSRTTTKLRSSTSSTSAGKPITPKERPKGENVVDLMDALRKSVGGAARETSAPKKPAKKSKKASAGQKEMLMPIAGKKQAAAKKPNVKPHRKSA
jgi:DNA end-binding protein Ku